MYRCYAPKPGMQPPKQGKPTAGEAACVRQSPPRQTGKAPQMQRREESKNLPKPQDHQESHSQKKKSNPVLSLLPTSVYNPETKKILGIFSAEDLLLAALIFLLLDSDDTEDTVLVYLLLYVLISEYIDLPF